MSRARRSFVALVPVGVALISGACVEMRNTLVIRASGELTCPSERLNLLERGDLGPGVYDVEACGRRARYTCIEQQKQSTMTCVHEPDPPAWDPDPLQVATLPKSEDGPVKVCGTITHDSWGVTHERSCDCLGHEGPSWRWVACTH
jgi:hypothetical protein